MLSFWKRSVRNIYKRRKLKMFSLRIHVPLWHTNSPRWELRPQCLFSVPFEFLQSNRIEWIFSDDLSRKNNPQQLSTFPPRFGFRRNSLSGILLEVFIMLKSSRLRPKPTNFISDVKYYITISTSILPSSFLQKSCPQVIMFWVIVTFRHEKPKIQLDNCV